MIDLHLHTRGSPDGMGTVADYCEAAISKGIKAIAVTDHIGFEPGLPDYGSYDHEATLREISAVKAHYGDKLTILAGVEVSYQSNLEDAIAKTLDGMEVDFIIGSVHSVGGPEYIITDEEGARSFFKNKMDAREVYGPYLEEVLRSVRFGYFDVLGHIDVIRRFGETMFHPLKANEYYGELRLIIEGLVKRDMALEVNSSGLYHAVKDIYPSDYILKLFRELGGHSVTFGSDAHNPGHVGRGFEHVRGKLKSCGFNELTVIERRTPRQVPL